MESTENTKLTDEQVDDIAKQLDDAIKGTTLEDIAKLPSNNGVEEREITEDTEKGSLSMYNVQVDPNTGEHKIIGNADSDTIDSETFEEMCERIKNQDIKLDSSPISEEEIIQYIANSMNGEESPILAEMCSDVDIDPEVLKELLVIVNRKMNREDFNIYKALPDQIKKMIDDYMLKAKISGMSQEAKQFRNMLCESLIDEFITNISLNRITTDFNKEVESIFSKSSEEIAESVVGYTEERNKAYREAAEKIDDPEKKEKILTILDRIDEGHNLTELKEFAKKCKIKPIEFEKPNRIFDSFLLKYKDSQYNIYDISMARPILYRNLNEGLETPEFNDKDINAFFIVFCKQCLNFKSENPVDHAYMYYAIYNIILLDINKSDLTRAVSDEFLENVKEVIYNCRERNHF